MIYVKIAALFFSLTGFGAWAWLGQVSGERSPILIDVKTVVPGVSPEVRAEAFALLDKVLAEAREQKEGEDSLAIQFLLADLLWEKDRARAGTIFLSIATAMEKGKCECAFFDIDVIAARDAKLAIQVLESTEDGRITYDTDSIYMYLAKQYPDEALNRGKSAVANGTFLDYLDLSVTYGVNSAAHAANGPGYSAGTAATRGGRLGALYTANRAHGSNLAKDILARIRTSSIDVPTPYPNYNVLPDLPARPPDYGPRSNMAVSRNANRPAGNYAANSSNYMYNAANIAVSAGNYTANYAANYPARSAANYWQARSVGEAKKISFSAAAALLTSAVLAEEQPKSGGPPMLTDDEKRSLASAMVNALIASRGRFEIHPVASMWALLKRSAPRDAARLERSLTRRQRTELNSLISPFDLPPVPDAADGTELPSAGGLDAETGERGFIFDLRYSSQYTCHSSRVEDAERFVALKDPEKYPDLIEYFGDDLAIAYAKAGNVEKVRTYLARESDRMVKLNLLSRTSAAAAKNGENRAAEKLLAEAAALVPQNLKRREEFGAVETYALARASVDPPKGFETVEKLLERADHLLGLRSELADFSRSHDSDTLTVDLRRRQIADNSAHSVAIIRLLAQADLDRTVKLADRFSEPRQRLFFRWYIINALLNRHAEKEQRRFAGAGAETQCG